MNTRTRCTATLVGIVTTCVLSAGAASAQPPHEPPAMPMTSPSPVTSHVQTDAESRAHGLLAQRSYVAHVERAFAEQVAAAARSRDAEQQGGMRDGRGTVHPGGSTSTEGSTSTAPQSSGDGSTIPVLAVTALAGLALGAGGTAASRRLRARSSVPA